MISFLWAFFLPAPIVGCIKLSTEALWTEELFAKNDVNRLSGWAHFVRLTPTSTVLFYSNEIPCFIQWIWLFLYQNMIGCANHNAISNPNCNDPFALMISALRMKKCPEIWWKKYIQKFDYHLDEFCSGQSHNHLKWIKKSKQGKKSHIG